MVEGVTQGVVSSKEQYQEQGLYEGAMEQSKEQYRRLEGLL